MKLQLVVVSRLGDDSFDEEEVFGRLLGLDVKTRSSKKI